MKKLITICLIMAATFATQAQNKELNKEETLQYMNKLGCNGYLTDIRVDANILLLIHKEFHKHDRKIEIDPYGDVSIVKRDEFYWIYYNNEVIVNLSIYSEAQRFKKAFDHLLELLKNDKSDPFGN